MKVIVLIDVNKLHRIKWNKDATAHGSSSASNQFSPLRDLDMSNILKKEILLKVMDLIHHRLTLLLHVLTNFKALII